MDENQGAVLSDKEKLVVTHYKSVGRAGKSLVKEKVTAGSDTARFLERMEQRRLSTACNIAIDMRGKVPGTCEAYEFQGLVHHMDEKCIEIFETEAARYDGKYTVGVFEKVQAADHTYKAQHEKESAERLAAQKQQPQAQNRAAPKDPLFGGPAHEKGQPGSSPSSNATSTQPENQVEEEEQHDIQLIPFGYRVQRKESRLNYTSAVNILLPDGHQVIAKTNDISPTGIKISLLSPIDALEKGTHIHIKFTALEEQFHRDLGKVEYQVIAQERDHHNRIQLRLARCDMEEKETFNKFIIEFIESYRARYKFELEDDLLALYAKAFERIYTLASPITINLLNLSAEGHQCLYSATRPDENSALKNSLFSSIAASLDKFLPNDPKVEEVLLETFLISGDNQKRVYCATREKLIGDNSFDNFLKIGSRAHLIARLLITIRPVNHQDLKAATQTLQPLLDKAPGRYEEIIRRWEKITHVAYLSLVEQKTNPDSRLTGQTEELKAVSNYELTKANLRVWQIGYRNQRQSERYLYNSPVSITIDKQTFVGTMVDFSPDGMRIQLDDSKYIPTSLEINKVIKVTLPELQKVAKKTAKLKDLSYRVTQWHPHQNSISLKRDFAVKNHEGSKFFTLLIKGNADKLNRCAEDLELTLMAEMLENLIASYLHGVPLFIARFPGGRYAVEATAATENANPLLWRFHNNQDFDFLPLNQELVFGEMIRPHLNRRSQLTKPVSTRFFAKFPNKSDSDEPISITGESQMKDTREIARFILMTRKNPNYRILKANFLPPPFIKLEEFSEDVRKIRNNSPNKAREFEQKIQHLVAIVEMEDITAFYQN